MKKSLKRTAAVVLAVATTAGVAGTTTLTTNAQYGNENAKVVMAESTAANYNSLAITKYDKTVSLYSEFVMPTVTFVDNQGAQQTVSNFVVTTPSGDTFNETAVTGGKFVVNEIGTYTVSYTYGEYTGEVTFVVEAAEYSISLLNNNENILPSKVAIKDKEGNAFTGEFKVPQYKVVNEEGEVEDAIVDIKLQTPAYETIDISSDKKVVFDANNKIQEGYYIITYTAYKKVLKQGTTDQYEKGEFLAETKTEFNAVSNEIYENEFDLTLVYASEKPQTVNVGKTITLPAVTAKNGNEAVTSYYSVKVYKNGSATEIAADAKVGNTDTLIITQNDKGEYEFTADEVGVYYRVEYTVIDGLGNTNKTSFNIDAVEDNIKPEPIVVDAYEVANVKDLKNKDYALKSMFGDEAVYIKAIYAEDAATFDYDKFTFERRIENSSRELVYESTNKEDARKELVFNYTGTETLDENKYVVVNDVTLKDGYYYVYYVATDANGNEKSVSYKFTIDKSFDWKDENGTDMAPTVKFNDTFYSSIDLGEKVEFGKVSVSDEKDDRLESSVYYKYDVDAETRSLELNDDGKYVIDTKEAPAGAAKLIIYAKAVNDGGKETVVEEEILLKSEIIGTSVPTIYEVDEDTNAYTYVQGSKIVIPTIKFMDGTDGANSLNATVRIKCTTADDKVIDYVAQDARTVKVGDYLICTDANFVAATAGNYLVSVKVTDAAGNAVIKFFNYTVTDASYTGALRFENMGIVDSNLELGSTYKLLAASITGKNSDLYDYYVQCVKAPGDYELSNSEFKPLAVGEYKLQYVMYEKADIDNVVESETVEFTITVADTTGPKINVVWETELLNGTEEKQSILAAYDKGTKILIPKFSAADMSGIDFEKSKIVISSSKTTRTIKLAEMVKEYSEGKDGLMYYTFNNDAEYTITYTAYDKAGNSNSVVKKIKIGDLVAPNLKVEDEIVGTKYNIGDTISVDLKDTKNYITVSDNKDTELTKDDVQVTLYVNGTAQKKDEASTEDVFTFTLKDAGEYELRFEVTDAAGLKSTVSKYFTIEANSGATMTSNEIVGTLLIVVSVLVLGGVVVYFVVSKRKMDKLYK